MKTTMKTPWIMAACLAVVAAGCVPSQDYPSRQTFGINPGAPEAVEKTQDFVLRVLPVRVAAPFATQKFTYRIGEDQYETDYYNGFVDTPDRLLTASLTEWLAAAGVFRAVIGPDSEASADFELETNVVELYGDYTRPGLTIQPYAMAKVRFTVLQRQNNATRMLFGFSTARPVFLQDDKPATLARGLGESWGHALTFLTQQLSGATFPATK